MPVSRLHRSGLTLVETGADFASVERDLALVDDRLFLSWEISRGRRVYRVLYDRGDAPPATVADWPHELSSGLVEHVKSLRPRGGDIDLEGPQRRNDERAARLKADADAAIDEIAADLGPRIDGKRSAVLHRTPGLVRSRRDRRAQGKEL